MRKITEMTQEGEIDSPWVSPIGQFTDDALAEDLAEDEEFRRIWEETATERHIARIFSKSRGQEDRVGAEE